MSSVPFYRDQGKAAGDLLGKGYHDSKKVTIKTKSEAGTAVEVSIAQVKGSDNFSASFKPKFQCPLTGADASVIMDGSKVAQIELVKSGLVAGLKTTVRCAPCDKAGGVSLDYEHAKFSATTDVNVKDSNASVAASLSFGSKARNAGVSAKLNGAELSELTFGVAGSKGGKYNVNFYTRCGMAKEKTIQSGVRVHYAADDNTALAVEGSVQGTSYKFDSKSFDVVVAASRKLDSATSVQAKLAKSGKLDVACKMAISKNTTVTFGGAFDHNSFTANGLEVAFDL